MTDEGYPEFVAIELRDGCQQFAHLCSIPPNPNGCTSQQQYLFRASVFHTRYNFYMHQPASPRSTQDFPSLSSLSGACPNFTARRIQPSSTVKSYWYLRPHEVIAPMLAWHVVRTCDYAKFELTSQPSDGREVTYLPLCDQQNFIVCKPPFVIGSQESLHDTWRRQRRGRRGRHRRR